MSVHPSKVSAMHFAQCDHCDWMAAAYTHHDAQAKDQAHAEACPVARAAASGEAR